MSFWSLYSSNMLVWVFTALVLAYMGGKIPIVRDILKPFKKAHILIGTIVIGMAFTGVVGGIGDSLGLSTVDEQTASDQGGLTGSVIIEMLDHGNSSTETGSYRALTSDKLNDNKDVMTIYMTDSDGADNYWFSVNATIEREIISEDANIKVICTAPDRELAGVTEKSLIDKSSGKVLLKINGGGLNPTDSSVRKYLPMSEGTATTTVTVSGQIVEAYHDGMTDLDNSDAYTISCTADSTPFSVVVIANS